MNKPIKTFVALYAVSAILIHTAIEPLTDKELASQARLCRQSGYELEVYRDFVRRPIATACFNEIEA